MVAVAIPLRANRIERVAVHSERHWIRSEISDLRLDLLTAAECEAAASVRDNLDAVGLSGISDAELDFYLCLHERLTGQRDAPCVLGAG